MVGRPCHNIGRPCHNRWHRRDARSRPDRRGGEPSASGLMGASGGVTMIGAKKLSAIRTEIETALASLGEDPIQRLEQQIASGKRKGDRTEVLEGLKRFLESSRKENQRKRHAGAKR